MRQSDFKLGLRNFVFGWMCNASTVKNDYCRRRLAWSNRKRIKDNNQPNKAEKDEMTPWETSENARNRHERQQQINRLVNNIMQKQQSWCFADNNDQIQHNHSILVDVSYHLWTSAWKIVGGPLQYTLISVATDATHHVNNKWRKIKSSHVICTTNCSSIRANKIARFSIFKIPFYGIFSHPSQGPHDVPGTDKNFRNVSDRGTCRFPVPSHSNKSRSY